MGLLPGNVSATFSHGTCSCRSLIRRLSSSGSHFNALDGIFSVIDVEAVISSGRGFGARLSDFTLSVDAAFRI